MALPGGRNNLLPVGHFWQGSRKCITWSWYTEAHSHVRKLIMPLEEAHKILTLYVHTWNYLLLPSSSFPVFFYANHHYSISKFTPSFCSPKTDHLQSPPLLQKSSVLICTSFLPTKWDMNFLFHKKRGFLRPQGGSERGLLILLSSAVFTLGREHFLSAPRRGEITDHWHVRPGHSRQNLLPWHGNSSSP